MDVLGANGSSPRSHPVGGGRRLVVLGDSLTFHGPGGPVPLHDPRLYPNVAAAALGDALAEPWEVQVWARAGWGVRELWLALQRDVHLQQDLLLGADAVLLACGNVDALSVGVPRPIMAALPYLRPPRLRRWVRRRIDRWHPALVRATGGRVVHTPDPVIAHCWTKSVAAVRLFAPGAAVVGVLPPVHDSPYHARHGRRQAQVHTLLGSLAGRTGVRMVDLAALSRPWLDRFNPDGIHWPWGLHAEVGAAVASALLAEGLGAVARRAVVG